MLTDALFYASLGWKIFPLHRPEEASPSRCSCWRPKCGNIGKHPRWMSGSLEHGQLDATSDADKIRTWWRCWPDANIGVRTGEGSGFVMVGPDGDEGVADLDSLANDRGVLPRTPVAVSGGGGRHYLFRHPGGKITNHANYRGTKIDVRGEGLFVAAPSLHKSGNRYGWEISPADAPIVEAPAWLIDWMRTDAPPQEDPARFAILRDRSLSIEDQAAKYVAAIPTPTCGFGFCDKAIFRVACVCCEGFDMDPGSALPLVAWWARRGNHPWKDGDVARAVTNASKHKTRAGYLLRSDRSVILDLGPANALVAAMSHIEIVEEDEPDDSPLTPDDILVEDFVVPGLISEVVRYNLETARYPQPQLALAGALCLMSALTGRKVRDEGDCRTNIYSLSLARSGVGKEHARRINRRILREAKLESLLGPETFKSGTAILTELKDNPALLCQLDEFNMLLRSLKGSHVAPHLQDVQTKFLTLYGSANDTYYGDGFADRSQRTIIAQPHLVIHGTAPLTDFWTSMSVEGVRDGLLGRMMIFEGKPTTARRSSVDGPPASLLDRVAWWGGMQVPLTGNVGDPIPHVMRYTREADNRLFKHVQETSQRSMAEDDRTAAIWARTPEKTTKLAMLFAASRAISVLDFEIRIEDVELAIRLSNWLTRKIMRRIFDNVSENDWEKNIKRVLSILDIDMTLNTFSRKTQWLKNWERKDIVNHLIDSHQIVYQKQESTGGRKPHVLTKVNRKRVVSVQEDSLPLFKNTFVNEN